MRRGFTLLELLVVLSILSIITAVVAPSMFSAVRPTALDESTTAVVRLLSQTRASAIARGATVQLVLVPGDGRYSLHFTSARDSTIAGVLPITLSVRLDDTRRRITVRFDGIGRATPETLLLRSGDRIAMISVDPWSGLASVTQR